MNRVGHTSCSKVLRLTCLWAAHVTHSDQRWWPSLVLLDSSCQDLCNSTSDVVIEVLVCFRGFFFLSFFSLLSLYWIVSNNFHKFHMWLSKLCYFSKYFFAVNYFINLFYYARIPENSRVPSAHTFSFQFSSKSSEKISIEKWIGFFLVSCFSSVYLHVLMPNKVIQETVMDCDNCDATFAFSAFLYTGNGKNQSCQAFLIYKFHPPYNTISSISNLLSSDPPELARINNFSSSAGKR